MFDKSSKITTASHLPREAVALAILEPEVSYFAVLDIHPRLSHVALGISVAGLAAVGDDLRDGADERPTIFVGRARAVVGGIPAEHLRAKRQRGRVNPTKTFGAGDTCDGGTASLFDSQNIV